MWVYGTEPAHLQLRKFDAHSIKFLEVTTVNEKKKQYYLYINGEAVPVTEKVYKTFWYFEDKEDYFMRQLKIPRRTQDKETCESVVVIMSNNRIHIPSGTVTTLITVLCYICSVFCILIVPVMSCRVCTGSTVYCVSSGCCCLTAG